MGFAGGAIGSQQMGIDSPDGTLKNLGARIEAAHSTNASYYYNRLRSVDSNCATATRDEPTLSLQKWPCLQNGGTPKPSAEPAVGQERPLTTAR